MSTDHGWFFKHSDDATEASGGPYSWQDLSGFAQQGVLAPDDVVWHDSLATWVPAQQVAGLFEAAPSAGLPLQSAPAPQLASEAPAAPPSAPQPTPASPQPPKPRSGRAGLVVGISVAVIVLVAAIGGAAWWFLAGRSGVSAGGPVMGTAEVKLPAADKLIVTEEWGEVPSNQIGILLDEGGKARHAKKVARALGGEVVGEVEFVSVYQIEFPASSEAELRAALDKAATGDHVAAAFPNQQDAIDAEIWGVRQDPYEDPMYGGDAGEGYKAIGVSKAWSLIKGSGIELNDVRVGVVDDGVYKPGEGRENEFGGDVEVEFPDPNNDELTQPEVWDDGTTNPAGSHGTGVTTIIGADPGNGGPAGIAGPLGKKLKITMINKYDGQYGQTTTTTPDAADPTKATIGNKTYSFGTLVALTKQVEGGAKVINCSFGKTDGHPAVAATYKKFFEKMAADHPDVIFVCSAGNDGVEVDGSKRFPSGHALPNMVTVGAVDNDGTLADYSNKKTGNYEVTLGAPGTQAVVGIKAEGGAEQQDGTSFAAPHVSAAAAILKSINPKLSAGEIKQLLTETARTQLKSGDKTVNAPAEVGGKILAIDNAVLKLLNQMRKEKGLKELTVEEMENAGVVDAVAITGEPGEYTVKGIVKAAGEKGVDLELDVTGENYAIGGKRTQSLSGPGEAKWSVTLPKDEGTARVTRSDNGASSLITIERFDINGNWSGSFTITDVLVSDQDAAETEGCNLVLLDQLKGKAMPMTMDISVNEAGVGTGVGLIDIAAVNGEGESEPQEYGVKLTGNSIAYTVKGGGSGYGMSSTVSRSGSGLVQKGRFNMVGPGFRIKAVFTLTKPDSD